MKIRANTEKGFFLKYLVIGILCLMFSAWSLYDGLFTYPAKIPRAEAWQKFQEEVPEEEWKPKWREISEREGWEPKRPTKDESVEEIEIKIFYQWIFLTLGLVIGLPLIGWYLLNKNTWVELDEGIIRGSWGEEFKPSQVLRFDKKKWEKKGIGVVHYQADDGPATFVLDDLKYERLPMDQIVLFVESQIDPKLIVNGKPEYASAESTASDSESDSDQEEVPDPEVTTEDS